MEQKTTPTGRTPQPFNPEPHQLPRRRGQTLALVVGPNGVGLRWTSTLALRLMVYPESMFVQVEQTIEGAQFCPVRFLPFYDIYAFDRGRKS